MRLLFGPFAAIIFAAGVTLLPMFVPGYDPIRQTVSEIGEVGSPMRWQFAAMLWVVALCVLLFAGGLWSHARASGRRVLGGLTALCTAWMGVAAAALGVFAHPHPLHNVFGISELVAYQAPFFCALAWGGTVRKFSTILFLATLASIALNLYAIADTGAFWDAVEPYYGLLQRSLFACFFIWCAGAGWLLGSADEAVNQNRSKSRADTASPA